MEEEKISPEEEKAPQEFAVQHAMFKKVDTITFGMLNPKMIKKMASVKVVTPELYDKEGYPVDGGLMDVRLGVIDPGLRCKTCGSKLKECIGHFGYIELARPAIHINYVKIILSLLRSSCFDCGRVLIPKEKIDKSKAILEKVDSEEGLDARRKAIKVIISSLKTVNKCPHCKAKQMKITIEKPTTFFEADKRLSPIEIRARLEKISDDDLTLFGINPKAARPEWSVLTVLPIPPVTMRPSITLESGERSEDDLTHKMSDIVRINQRLFENINAGAPEIIIEDLWDLLQYHVTTFFDNKVSQLPPARHRSGQPLETLKQRIESKGGRIRHNLAGKRTNFCARTVISPDPRIRLNEVGIPEIVAAKITVPEMVQPWNMKYLKAFVEKGPKEYPGANYIVRPDGRKKKITDETKEAALEELQPGYYVERHLMDGDIALFNRQPSLHRMSMMCHKIKVLPGRTFRINPAVCAPYNADFDGDEMNLHVPQTEESRAEAEVLMDVQTQFVSPRYGLSTMGCIQDALSGNYVLTKSMSFTKEEAVDALCSIGVHDFSRLPNKKQISGKELFSVLLPDDFNFKGKSKSGDDLEIKNGTLITGIIDEKSIGGEGSGLLLRSLHKHYGAEKTMNMLHMFNLLGTQVLLKRGFTVTLSDSDLPQEAKDKIDEAMNQGEQRVLQLVEDYKQGKLDPFPGTTAEETLERKIIEELNKARNLAGQIVKKFMDDTSHTFIMSDSGARGKLLNLAQMAAVFGQNALQGKRISKGYRGRTLSSFKKGDLSPNARGFTRSSFKKGLKPFEFFFGAITGRDSLMDTALRTPKSGYLYRRLANAMQDLRVEYDNTVRDASGKIIQFSYGEDGIDVAKSESGTINIPRIIDEV
jgi:DNA-directed RNA polymerase subunit A'